MKPVGWLFLLLATVCSAQESSDFRPASTNVRGAQYPRVDGDGRVEIRIKAPDATKVRVNFWSGPKLDMVKQPDGVWTVTTPALVPGLHYYTLILDGAEVTDLGSHAFFGGGKHASRSRYRSRARPTIPFRMCRMARCARSGTSRR